MFVARKAKGLHEAIIERAVETGTIGADGLLSPVQQTKFIELVQAHSGFVRSVRFVRMKTPEQDIPRLYMTTPISYPVTERDPTSRPRRVLANAMKLRTKKLKSDWPVSTEIFWQNVEQDGFEDTLMRVITEKVTDDLDSLGIRGDSAIVPSDEDPWGLLWSTTDGLLKLARSQGHVVDAEGAEISTDIFHRAARSLPKRVRDKGDLAWLMGRALWQDYANELSGRTTELGDAAISAKMAGVRPAGYRALILGNMPEDESITIGEASRGMVSGVHPGPFRFWASGQNQNNLLDISVDGVGPTRTTLPEGVLTLGQVAAAVRGELLGAGHAVTVALSVEGGLQVASMATGALSTITVHATGTLGGEAAREIWPHALADYSLPVQFAGAAAATAVEPVGSPIILTPPKNIVVGVVDGTRIFTEYNMHSDAVEIVIYNDIAIGIEDPDALLVVDNLRLRDYTGA